MQQLQPLSHLRCGNHMARWSFNSAYRYGTRPIRRQETSCYSLQGWMKLYETCSMAAQGTKYKFAIRHVRNSLFDTPALILPGIWEARDLHLRLMPPHPIWSCRKMIDIIFRGPLLGDSELLRKPGAMANRTLTYFRAPNVSLSLLCHSFLIVHHRLTIGTNVYYLSLKSGSPPSENHLSR